MVTQKGTETIDNLVVFLKHREYQMVISRGKSFAEQELASYHTKAARKKDASAAIGPGYFPAAQVLVAVAYANTQQWTEAMAIADTELERLRPVIGSVTPDQHSSAEFAFNFYRDLAHVSEESLGKQPLLDSTPNYDGPDRVLRAVDQVQQGAKGVVNAVVGTMQTGKAVISAFGLALSVVEHQSYLKQTPLWSGYAMPPRK